MGCPSQEVGGLWRLSIITVLSKRLGVWDNDSFLFEGVVVCFRLLTLVCPRELLLNDSVKVFRSHCATSKVMGTLQAFYIGE